MSSNTSQNLLENNFHSSPLPNNLDVSRLATSPPSPPRSSLLSHFFPKPSNDFEEDLVEDNSSAASSDSESEGSWVLAGRKDPEELSGGGGAEKVEVARVEETVVVQVAPSQPLLESQLKSFKSDVEQKLRLQSSLQQSFEMSVDERFASLKEEIKRDTEKKMKDVANEEIKTALALHQKALNVQFESVRASQSKRLGELEAKIISLEASKTQPSTHLSTPDLLPRRTTSLETPSSLLLADSSPQPQPSSKKIVHTIPPSVPHTLSEQITSLLLHHTPSLLSASLTHPQAHHLAAFTLVTSILDLPLFLQPLLASDDDASDSNSTEPIRIVVQAFFQRAIYSNLSMMDRWANLFQTFVDQLATRLGECGRKKRKFVVTVQGGPLVLDEVSSVVKHYLEKECQEGFNDRDALFPSHHYHQRINLHATGRGTDPLIVLIAQLFLSEPERLLPKHFMEKIVDHLTREVLSNPGSDVQALWDLLSASGVGARLEVRGKLRRVWGGIERRRERWEEVRVDERKGVGEEWGWVKEGGREVRVLERHRELPEKLTRLRASGWSPHLAQQMKTPLKPMKMRRMEAAGEW